MDNKHLDTIIKNKLTQISPLDVGGAWDIFEHKLDATSQYDAKDFDDLIQHKILERKQHYQHDWRLMQHFIATVDQRRNTVFGMKALELLMVLVMIYTVGLVPIDTIVPAHPGTLPKIPTRPKNEYAINLKAQKDNRIQTPFTSQKRTQGGAPTVKTLRWVFGKPVINKAEIANVSPIISHNNETSFSDDKFVNMVDQSVIAGINKLSENQTIAGQSIPSSELQSELISGAVINNESFVSNDLVDPKLPISNATGREMAQSIQNESGDDLSRKLDVTPNIELINSAPESEFAYSFPMRQADSHYPNIYSIGLWASGDINFINTPYDKVFSLAAYEHNVSNHAFGISLSKRVKSVEWETGLEYAVREYQPRQFVEKYGTAADYYYESSLEKIKFELVNIPIKVKYDFWSNKDVRIYGMFGASLNLILNADYTRHEEIVQGRPSIHNVNFENDSRLGEKNFITGITSSVNSLKDNYFVGLNFGLGFEKKISTRISAYIEPSYQHHILSNDIGIGPNKDLIHTASLRFGVKSVLL